MVAGERAISPHRLLGRLDACWIVPPRKVTGTWDHREPRLGFLHSLKLVAVLLQAPRDKITLGDVDEALFPVAVNATT